MSMLERHREVNRSLAAFLAEALGEDEPRKVGRA